MTVHAHRLDVHVGDDHRLELDLPRDFPKGDAEVIVLAKEHRSSSTVRLGGAFESVELLERSGDPIAEALEDLRAARTTRLTRYAPESIDS